MRTPTDASGPRDKLIHAAEATIQRVGLDDLNLRDITHAAGANLAAVNYHFGGKSGLLFAVLDRRLTPVHAERLRRLSAVLANAGDEPPPLDDVMAALIDPLFETLSELGDLAPTMMELALRLLTKSRDRLRVPEGDTSLIGMLRHFDRAIARALPELDPAERWRRLMFVTGLLFQIALLDPFMRELNADLTLGRDLGALRESMKQFAVAGLRAPLPRAAARRRGTSRRKP